MKLLALTALLATAKAQDEDNTAAIAAGKDLICSPSSFPEANINFEPLSEVNIYANGSFRTATTLEECYAKALAIVMMQFTDGDFYEECYHAKEVEASEGVEASFSCWNTFQATDGGFDEMDIRVVAEEEAGVTYHAWQWNEDVSYDEEPEAEEEEEEEEGGQMLTTTALSAALFILTQV
jgi:hypothetical protein